MEFRNFQIFNLKGKKKAGTMPIPGKYVYCNNHFFVVLYKTYEQYFFQSGHLSAYADY